MISFDHFFPREVKAFVSDRSMDFTLGPGISELTKRQREYLSSHLQSLVDRVVMMKQVHGDCVVVADDFKSGPPLREADAIVTATPGVLMTVRTADCLPLFIYDPRHHGLGLVHAGWKGSQKNIVGKALQMMREKWESEPKDLQVALGPAIRACCYEVGAEFGRYFPEYLIHRNDYAYLDLPQVNKDQLEKIGVLAENIFDCEICTHCSSSFFSYRREKDKAGRMISVMMLEKDTRQCIMKT